MNGCGSTAQTGRCITLVRHEVAIAQYRIGYGVGSYGFSSYRD